MLLLLLWSLLFAPINNLAALEHHKLDNGLEVFLIENHTTPLMHFRIVFKTGAINEDEKTNGLSHLYEHILFDGNALYKTENAFQAAFKSLGTAGWNGATGTEQVYYYFTIPSSKAEKGIELWANAVINPLLEPATLKREIPIVMNEVAGIHAQANYIFYNKILETLYKYPSRKMPAGRDLSVISKATIEQLKYFKNNFYVPNNAAIIIAGDINSKQTLESVKKYFGNWEKGKELKKIEKQPRLKENKWVALDNSPSKGEIDIRLFFIGPDSDTDTKFTYPADIWTTMMEEPDSNFKKNIYKAVPELFGETRNIDLGYATEREGSTYFNFTLVIDEKKDMLEVTKRLVKAVDKEFDKMLADNYFTKEAFESAKKQTRDRKLLAMETIEGASKEIEFWWSVTSTDYYLNYLDNLNKVTVEDIKGYIKTFLKTPKLTAAWINKDDNKKIKLMERFK